MSTDSYDLNGLFGVEDLIIVVTGGGSGKFFTV